MSIAIALSAVLGAVCVVLVALPFLREPEPVSDELEEMTPERQRRLALAEERDRALSALKELEADHRARRINDEDYRASIGQLRREAAGALRALDRENEIDSGIPADVTNETDTENGAPVDPLGYL
ncbi:MAG: hypothetical protein LH654_06500 [Thermoleophilia bacterium]|nr:hypothetical protein [Thermoleophilia bacterium]